MRYCSRYAVGLVVDVIATAQAAVKSGCAEGDFLD